MSREVITVDLDDVIVGTADAIIDHVNAKYGSAMTIDKFYSRDPAVWGAPDIATAIQRVNDFVETDEFFALPPMQEAIHALRNLRRVHQLYIVTGRPDFTELATRQWLRTHLPEIFEDVVFTNYFDADKVRTKGDICRTLGATVLIDDHLDHCQSAAEQGVRALLFGTYPWNRAEQLPKGIERVSGWPEVESLLLPDEQG